MKIIQSFWTKPVFQDRQSIYNDRAKGGWLTQSAHFMAWALSCLCLRQYYDEVELITDDLGKFILIDLMQLPYTRVDCSLNELNSSLPDLWALGKIKAYSMQTQPFIHVDGDVFIFSRFSERIEKAELLCQNLDVDHIEYRNILNDMLLKRFRMPSEMSIELKTNDQIIACNAGILGGSNTSLINRYCELAFQMVETNLELFDEIHAPTFNIIYEQYLFYCLAKNSGIAITKLFDQPDLGFEPKALVRFHMSPYSNQYIHMISNYKRNPKLIEKMITAFRTYHPEQYYYVTARLKEENLL